MKRFLKKIRYFFEYLIFSIIIRILHLLGINRSADFCSYIVRKIGPLLQVNQVAKKNIQNVFHSTDFNQASHEQIIDQSWNNFGRFIGEFPYVNKMSEEELCNRIKIVGLENIEKFRDAQQPFLLFSGHFANWELATRILNRFYDKFTIVYRKANNPYIDKVINNIRNNNLNFIPKGISGAKQLIKAIKSGHAIAMLVDQKMNDGIPVPFFGRNSMTSFAIAKIAIQFQYPIIPLQIIRTNNSSYFEIIIHSPLKFIKTKDNNVNYYNIMLNINQILESWIKEHPEQWFWFHNRWTK